MGEHSYADDPALAVSDPVREALEGKSIAGYTPGADRPAYRTDLQREAISFGGTVRVLAKSYTVDGRTWSDRPDGRQQEARVLVVTTPAHLPAEQICGDSALPNPRRDEPRPLPTRTNSVVAVDAVVRRGPMNVVELTQVEPVRDEPDQSP